ncbi:MAG: hypothetical protein K8S13_20310, partial [Desulfobacula sp.]|nr:hypothetical protein [Desulfobacula sp.]
DPKSTGVFKSIGIKLTNLHKARGITTSSKNTSYLNIGVWNVSCIEACPEDVQTIGPRKEILKKAHALAKEINGYIYGEHENGGTNTIYVSPVPFDELNKNIEKGEGKPHFENVRDKMASGNNIAKAMLIAPLAGIAAAAGKLYKAVKEEE